MIDRTEKLIVKDIAMRGLYIVQDKENQWPHYVTRHYALDGRNFVEIDSWRQDRASEKVKINLSNIKNRKTERAPQFELKEQYEKHLNSITATNWEFIFAEMIKSTISAKKVDPILKMRMLMILQLHAKEGSLVLEQHEGFTTFVNELTEASQDVNLLAQWPDPKDEDVEVRRGTAERYITGLKSVNPDRTWVPEVTEFKELTRKLKTQYRVIGLMDYDQTQQPILDLELPETGQWKIVVAVPGKSKEAAFTFTQLGFSDAGQAKISDSSTGIDFLPGRLVFAISAKK